MVASMDATVYQVVLPHLTHLTSFEFQVQVPDEGLSVIRSVWASFLASGIKLSDVEMDGIVTKEMILYLPSFSGLKSLVLEEAETPPDIHDMFFANVLPRHVNFLQSLRILGADSYEWAFDRDSSRSIMKCLELRDLYVCIDGEKDGMPVQLLLDTVARLPELEILHTSILDDEANEVGLANFKPTEGLCYVEVVDIDERRYVLKNDEEQPVRYQEIIWDEDGMEPRYA